MCVSEEGGLTDLACVVTGHRLCVTRESLLSFQIPGGPLWPQTPPSANRSVWQPPSRVSVCVSGEQMVVPVTCRALCWCNAEIFVAQGLRYERH